MRWPQWLCRIIPCDHGAAADELRGELESKVRESRLVAVKQRKEIVELRHALRDGTAWGETAHLAHRLIDEAGRNHDDVE